MNKLIFIPPVVMLIHGFATHDWGKHFQAIDNADEAYQESITANCMSTYWGWQGVSDTQKEQNALKALTACERNELIMIG